ncbi:MAG: DNA primase [Desulfosalsimonadaceae bacterium]
MALNIPEEKLSEIRNAADIVDVISSRVILKKTGKDYSGLCPFHTEKTPSFTVSPAKQIFHCFGCGTGGNVFNFLMLYENMTFPEAVETLSRQYGIPLPSRKMTEKEKKQISQRQHLLEINRKVSEFYREMLLKRQEGEHARRYLAERNTRRELVDKFGLGFAPGGWDSLVRFLNQHKIAMPMAEKAGLVAPRQSGGYYDRFRNRVIFPIFDATGQVVAFGGRVLDDAKPKYLNSPETPLYNKRRVLYGLHAAREKCRTEQSVYVVEGYFDLLSMHQFGIGNSVATLGTALTSEHVRRLKGYAKKAFLVFDSDEAGIKAAHRTTGIFIDEGMEAAVVLLPKGHDPDSFLFEYGANEFFKIAEKALGLVDFQIQSAIERNGNSLEGKIRIISELAQPLAQIADSSARSIYVRYLAEKIRVDETTILEKIAGAQGGATIGEKPSVPGSPAADRFEARIIAMMLQYPDILDEIRKQGVLEHFEDKRLKSIGERILGIYPHEAATVAEFINRLEDETHGRLVASICIEDAPWGEQSCQMLLSQFFTTKGRRKNDLLDRIRSAEKNGDQELVMKLLNEKQNRMAKRQ